MALSAREAFKVGFLARCAADGLNSEEIHTRVKAAYDAIRGPEKQADFESFAGHTFDSLGKWGPAVAIGAPLVTGALGGYGLAKLNDSDDTDVADVKRRELMDEYRRQSHRLRSEASLREQTATPRRSGRPSF